MSKRLENFIDEHRREFDSESPSPELWNRIEAGLTGKKKSSITPIARIARIGLSAAAVLVIAAGAYFLINTRNTGSGTTTVQPLPTTADVPEVTPFIHMISLKQEELKTLSKEQPELYSQFTKDITQLDSSYQSLKSQMAVTPNRELLLEAMIHNLQLQLDVLNQQLNIINQIKQKKYSHEQVI